MTLSAVQYHRETSYRRDRMGGPSLDWANQPNVYKTYPGIEPIPLPREPALLEVPLLELFGQSPAAVPKPELTAEDLSAILLLTHSLTAKARHPGGDFYYRATASAGALYPTEIYAALTAVQGLEDGLYHFSIARQGFPCSAPGRSSCPYGQPAGAARPRTAHHLFSDRHFFPQLLEIPRPGLALSPAGYGPCPRTPRPGLEGPGPALSTRC